MIEILNAEEKHRANPKSFWIPTQLQRYGLKPGNVAKLIFRETTGPSDPSAERMWVLIKSVKRNGKPSYIGSVDNHPITPHGPKYGHTVVFGPEHIIDVYTDPLP